MLDWTHINSLRQEVGQDGFQEIVDLFFAEVQGVFDRVRKDGPTHTDMHFLKGSAANLGFVAFSKACQIAEHALLAKQDDVDIEPVFDSYKTSCHTFAAGLKTPSA